MLLFLADLATFRASVFRGPYFPLGEQLDYSIMEYSNIEKLFVLAVYWTVDLTSAASTHSNAGVMCSLKVVHQ